MLCACRSFSGRNHRRGHHATGCGEDAAHDPGYQQGLQRGLRLRQEGLAGGGLCGVPAGEIFTHTACPLNYVAHFDLRQWLPWGDWPVK